MFNLYKPCECYATSATALKHKIMQGHSAPCIRIDLNEGIDDECAAGSKVMQQKRYPSFKKHVIHRGARMAFSKSNAYRRAACSSKMFGSSVVGNLFTVLLSRFHTLHNRSTIQTFACLRPAHGWNSF